MSGTTTTYAYDGDGKRATQTVGGSTTNYVYDVNTSLPDVLTDGTLKYVYGLGLAFAADSSGTVQVYHADGLGSVRAITDGSGNVVQTYQSDAFGNPTQTQGSSTQPFQFTGEQRDGSGLIYLRARYYDSPSGRFITRDEYAGSPSNPASLHRYTYVENRPTVFADPSGYCGPLCVAGAAAAVLEGGGDIGVAIAAGGAAVSAIDIYINHDNISESLDQLWELLQHLGPSIQQVKLYDERTGEVILDTENPPKTYAITSTPANFPPPPTARWDKNAPLWKKIFIAIGDLLNIGNDVSGNLPPGSAPPSSGPTISPR